jgi:hypothetical protein
MTFLCPDCGETYRDHWRDRTDQAVCRTCGERRDGFCKWADDHPGHFTQHPCSTSTEDPGSPCRYCATPVPVNGDPCPDCWKSLTGMNLADVKAVFAADAEAVPEGTPVFEVIAP